MKFRGLLTFYRERADLTKSQLAERIDVKPEYIINVENGYTQKPPTLERCHQISKALSLSPAETKALCDAAMEERLSEEALLWLTEREKNMSKINQLGPEILEAINDPIALKALLVTHKNKEEIKRAIQDVIENIANLPKEKRMEILKLCH